MSDRILEIDKVSKEYRLGVYGSGTLQRDLQSWFARVRGKEDPNRKINAKQQVKGEYFMARLKEIKNSHIIDVRGRGLLIGVEFDMDAAPYVKKLIHGGVLAKETHERTIRFAPPVVISYAELDKALEIIREAFAE